MPAIRHIRQLLIIVSLIGLTACAGLGLREPLKVSVAGLEPLPSEGLEARFAVRLRVQNPNDTAFDYDGVALELQLADIDFGSGVSNQHGSIPGYGETVITVPVTVPFLAIVRQLVTLTGDEQGKKISYRLRGHLGGVGLGDMHFDTHGELLLPSAE